MYDFPCLSQKDETSRLSRKFSYYQQFYCCTHHHHHHCKYHNYHNYQHNHHKYHIYELVLIDASAPTPSLLLPRSFPQKALTSWTGGPSRVDKHQHDDKSSLNTDYGTGIKSLTSWKGGPCHNRQKRTTH